MTPSTASFLALVVLIVLNRALSAGLRKGSVSLAFWPLQALNLAAVAGLAFWGMPGFGGRLRVMDAFVAALVLLHVVENLHFRAVARERRHRAALLREEERLLGETRAAMAVAASAKTGGPPSFEKELPRSGPTNRREDV